MKNLKKWLLLGLLVRLLIMPFTGHWDLTSLNQVAASFWQGKEAVYQHYYAIYPPLAYAFWAVWQKIISPFVFSDFSTFLNSTIAASFLNYHVYRYLFLLKLPYLFFDLGIGLLLTKLFSDNQKQEKIFKLWMLNPITLYATFAWGTLDIIPAFLTVLALYLAHRQKGFWACIALGLGASFKAYPLLLLPVLCLVYFSKTRERILAIFLGLLPFILSISFFLGDKNFLQHFFSSDQLQIIQHASFYIGREQFISLFYIFYVLLLIFLWQKNVIKEELNWFFFLVLFAFYMLSAFTPQWFIWGLPFFFIEMVKGRIGFKWYVLVLLIYFLLVLLFEVTLNFGLLGPWEVTLLVYPSLGEKINTIVDVNRVNGILHSILTAVILWWFYQFRPTKMYENN